MKKLIQISSVFIFGCASLLSVGALAQSGPPSIEMARFGRISAYALGAKLQMEIRDPEIASPKSVRFSGDGTKIYINSLEGARTVVYSWPELKKLRSIVHRFKAQDASLFQGETTIFDYPYLAAPPNGQHNVFEGKPVESELSHDGRYLWIPYYRRSWDRSGQSPGAVAIIDTKTDEIVRVMPTGPIPKYVVASPDGRFVAVIHWGDNTIGLIDTSSGNPRNYSYVAHLKVETQMSQSGLAGTDRDRTCGFCLRGSVFSPDGNYLFVARMGQGGIAGFHLPSRTYLGSIMNVRATPRHLSLSPDGRTLYASSNVSGFVSSVALDDVIRSLTSAQGRRVGGPKWQEGSVGQGARTLAVHPSGRVLLVAVNNSSELVAVDSQSLKRLTSLSVDRYAVGLAISPDGSSAIVTSQGRDGVGGNAVNLFAIRLNDPVTLPLK